MRSYPYTCPVCNSEGMVHTTDGPPEKEALCAKCWRARVEELCLSYLQERTPTPAVLDELCSWLVEEHGMVWESPLRMMRLTPDLLVRMLKRTSKVKIETIVSLEEA